MKDKALQARLTAHLRDTKGLCVVEPLSGPDGLDRVHFAAYWWANNIGWSCNETGVRGQHFFATLESFKARHEDGEVVMLEDVPTLPGDQLELARAA